MSRVVEEETDLCRIGQVNGQCVWGDATLRFISFGSQLFFNCAAICCDYDGVAIRITMFLCLPFRLISTIFFGALGFMLDLLYTIFVLPFAPCCCHQARCTLEDWGMRAIYQRDAKKQVRKTRISKGRTVVYWQTVATWNIWNRSGPWEGFDCCSGTCCHAVFCMASWQGDLVSMGCDCCADSSGDSGDDEAKENPIVPEIKVDIGTPVARMQKNNSNQVANSSSNAGTQNDWPPNFDLHKPQKSTHGGRPVFVRLSSAVGIPVQHTTYDNNNPI